MEKENNLCLNDKSLNTLESANSKEQGNCNNATSPVQIFTKEMKLCLLKLVVDDLTLKNLTDENKINEAFDFNLANIIISTRGQF